MLFILIVFTKPTLNQHKQTKTTCNVGILVAIANIGYLALTAANVKSFMGQSICIFLTLFLKPHMMMTGEIRTSEDSLLNLLCKKVHYDAICS